MDSCHPLCNRYGIGAVSFTYAALYALVPLCLDQGILSGGPMQLSIKHSVLFVQKKPRNVYVLGTRQAETTSATHSDVIAFSECSFGCVVSSLRIIERFHEVSAMIDSSAKRTLWFFKLLCRIQIRIECTDICYVLEADILQP